jgi:predicted amidohydrolase
MASRHYAFEGKCFVICVGSYMTLEHIPRDFELYDRIADMADAGGTRDLLPGGSGIIGPDGAWIAGPVAGREEIVYGEIDLGRLLEERLLLDTVGHYNRPDIFQLTVNRQAMPHARWVDDATCRPTDTAADEIFADGLPRPPPDGT